MGAYINPPTMEKEEWLKDHGILVNPAIGFNNVPKGQVMCCLIDNGFFTALGVLYKESEYEEFTRSGDNRPKKYYLVQVSDLDDAGVEECYMGVIKRNCGVA